MPRWPITIQRFRRAMDDQASTRPGLIMVTGFDSREIENDENNSLRCRLRGYGLTAGSAGEAAWGGFGATSFLIDPKERVIAIMMSQGPSALARLSALLRELTWGALVR